LLGGGVSPETRITPGFRERISTDFCLQTRVENQALLFCVPFFQGDCSMYKVMNFVMAVAAIMVLTFVFSPLIAWADWDPSQPAKYVQMPDPNGMNVNATYLSDPSIPIPLPVYPWQKILADDFLCTETGPITDIHIWGSWLENRIPFMSAAPTMQNVSFKLSLHTNVLAGVDATYSHPGQEVWQEIFSPGQYTNRFWSDSTELFYEPNTNQIIGADSQIWQYNFNIDPAKAYTQQGTAANPQVYWLDVQAIVPELAPVPDPTNGKTPPPEFVFGWKTSRDGFTVPGSTLSDDDAVYGDTLSPGGLPYNHFPDINDTGLLPWKDMHYPTGPYQGQSINMAFAITPEPSTILMLAGAFIFGISLYARRRAG
jgi:hypothetical protein